MSSFFENTVFIVYELIAIALMFFSFYCFIYLNSARRQIIKELKELKELVSERNRVSSSIDNSIVDIYTSIKDLLNTTDNTKSENNDHAKINDVQKSKIIEELRVEYPKKLDDYSNVNFTIVVYSNNINSVLILKEMQKDLELNNVFISLNEINRLLSLKKDKNLKYLYLKTLYVRAKKRLQVKK